jgi:hypothetical protein
MACAPHYVNAPLQICSGEKGQAIHGMEFLKRQVSLCCLVFPSQLLPLFIMLVHSKTEYFISLKYISVFWEDGHILYLYYLKVCIFNDTLKDSVC